jgi:putative addiction module component (TIGR02574 family)
MSQVNTQAVITSALSLPESDRLTVLDAIRDSLLDPTLDHDGADSVGPTSSAWSDEIRSRLDDIDSGRVKTVPAEAAEQMIRGNAKPIL